MLGTQIFIGTMVNLFCVVFHVVSLIYLAKVLKSWSNAKAENFDILSAVILISVTSLAIIVFHSVEASIWALVYYWCGEFSSMERAMYFSFVTFTTLGFGDITLSLKWQLLSSFEAMGGLIIFGASTAFFLTIMRYLFDLFVDQKKSEL
jgi:voltage-gated potassium channel